jgi:hypothetical protein
MNIEKFVNEPSVPCPEKLESPFLKAANSIGDHYNHYELQKLKKILLKIEELILQQKVEELRQAGEELRQEAKSIESRRASNWNVSDSYFRFNENIVPFIGEATDEDIALYLIITGKLERQIPLRIAQFIVEDDFDWDFLLSEIRSVGEIIPAIPETIIKLPQIRVDEKRRLVIEGWNSNPAIELGVNWRERRHPICDAVQESSDDKLWSKESVEANLVRSDDKYIWLSTEAPSKATLLCPGLIQLKDHFGEIAECLKLWRADLGKPNDSSARLKRWLESKSNAAPWIAHIAEMILINFSPWPDPYHIRPQDNAARGLNSDKCLRQSVLPLFRELEKAPCSDMPNLVARFISCIRALIKAKPDWTHDAHGFPGNFSESWTFKLRTRDHSYIKGEIVGEPNSTFISNLPLEFRDISSSYEPERFCVWSGEIYCFITEEKDKRY